MAGIFSAVTGGLLVTLLGGSHLNIKGPAAGLIIIAIGSVSDLGQGDALLGYRLTLAVIVVAIPMGIYFDLEHKHKYLFLDGHEYSIGPKFLVTLPENRLSAVTFPDFSQVLTMISEIVRSSANFNNGAKTP